MKDLDSYQIKIAPDMRELAECFIENRKKDIVKIDTFLKKNDYSAIQTIGHNLAGNAGTYGFSDLGEIGRRIEAMAIEKKKEEIVVTLEEIKDFVGNVKLIIVGEEDGPS